MNNVRGDNLGGGGGDTVHYDTVYTACLTVSNFYFGVFGVPVLQEI